MNTQRKPAKFRTRELLVRREFIPDRSLKADNINNLKKKKSKFILKNLEFLFLFFEKQKGRFIQILFYY